MRRIYMLCGHSGVGKSTCANILAKITNARLICADELRQEVIRTLDAGIAPYSPVANARTYALLMSAAQQQLISSNTENVVLDATFLTRKLRMSARKLANEGGAELIAVVLHAERAIVDDRLLLRRDPYLEPGNLRLQIAEDHRRKFEEPGVDEVDVIWRVCNDGTIPALECNLRDLTETARIL